MRIASPILRNLADAVEDSKHAMKLHLEDELDEDTIAETAKTLIRVGTRLNRELNQKSRTSNLEPQTSLP